MSNFFEQKPSLGTVFHNGVVSFTKDLVFGLSVLTDNGWVPLDSLERVDYEQVLKALDNNPLFPFKSELAEIDARQWDWFCTICDKHTGHPSTVCCSEVQSAEFKVRPNQNLQIVEV